MPGTVTASDAGGIRTLELAAGERNLLDPPTMGLLHDALVEADSDPAVLGILLTSSGDVFCGGLDIAAIRAGANPVEFAAALARLFRLMPRLTQPVAAAVQGDALAGGAGLVAAVDYAVAVPTARIGSQEVAGGIWPMVAQVPLVHRIGARNALENIGCGEPFTARRAHEVGLVQAVVEPDQLVAAARRWLELAQRGAAAYALGRPSLFEIAQLDYDTALDTAYERFASMFTEQS
jgi:enoyl-CoA hydratase/carnithine racemase